MERNQTGPLELCGRMFCENEAVCFYEGKDLVSPWDPDPRPRVMARCGVHLLPFDPAAVPPKVITREEAIVLSVMRS